MKHLSLTLTLLLVLFSSIVGEELKIGGGTAHLKVMKAVAKLMEADNSDLDITISGGGSGVGIKSVGEGLFDIGNSGRELKKSEIEKYGLVPTAIAIDGIAVVVNPENGVKEISKADIIKIFSGEINNWKQLGGVDATINIYTRDSKSGTRKTFSKLALNKGKIDKNSLIVNSNGNMKQSISNDKNGIGYVSVGYLDDSVQGVTIDGVEPTLENVKNQKYKIQRFLYSVTKGEPKGVAKKFLDMVLSDKGQEIVKKYHLISVK